MYIYVDINECDGAHDCDQDCTNTDGSYICSCGDGYVLGDNERSCVGKLVTTACMISPSAT